MMFFVLIITRDMDAATPTSAPTTTTSMTSTTSTTSTPEPVPASAVLDEYEELIRLLETSDGQRAGDVYAELIAKERGVLEIINRVAQQRDAQLRITKLMQNSLTRIPVGELFHRFSRSLHDIFIDVISIRKLYELPDLPWLLLDGERKVHVGVLIVMIAMILYFMDIAA